MVMFVRVLLGVLAMGLLAAEEPLRVLVWNTERGSNPYGPTGKERVLKVIKDSKADVVLWQESYPLEGMDETLGAWVSKQLGWNFWQGESPHLAVATRFTPIEEDFHHPWHGLGARLKDDAGREFVAWSIWLDHRAPVQWASVAEPSPSDEELLACDTTLSDRFKQAQALLDDLDRRGLLDSQVPVLVGGDWNCSSHLDWTARAAERFPHRRPLPLPISRLMHSAGFDDAFRVVHTDPAEHPGNTWTPRGDQREDGSPDPPERIDRLYVKNAIGRPGLQPVKATVFPLNPEDARAPRTEAVFPSDHAATLIELEWVESDGATAGAFEPQPASASPGVDHRAPKEVEPGFAPTRIVWGSCFRESQPCPMLDTLAKEKPELYFALGDNIYGDTQDMGVLRMKYRRLARHPGWRALTDTARVIATWDDHDYGADDSGENYKPREASKEIFLDFFDEPASSVRRKREGIHASSMLGPEDRRIQCLMLDLRTFRSDLIRDDAKPYPELGRYRALRDDEAQRMMSEAQWAWLEEELNKPAKLRLIGLSTQLGSGHNGHEAWANMPKERERFLALLEKTKAEGVILLSGDTHWAEVSLVERPGFYPIYDLTSSSLNQQWDPAGANPNRIGTAYTKPNAGVMDIDWEAGMVKTRILDASGGVRIALEIPMDQLRLGVDGSVSDVSGVWESAFGELHLEKEGGAWKGRYPGGACTLAEQDGVYVGRWSEGERGGVCRFRPSSCGRFLQGAYGRADGEALLPWPAWRADAEGVEFVK